VTGLGPKNNSESSVLSTIKSQRPLESMFSQFYTRLSMSGPSSSLPGISAFPAILLKPSAKKKQCQNEPKVLRRLGFDLVKHKKVRSQARSSFSFRSYLFLRITRFMISRREGCLGGSILSTMSLNNVSSPLHLEIAESISLTPLSLISK